MNPGDEFILIEAYVTFEDMLAYDNHYMPLVCSYDPNDMQASPMGVCASNYIEQDSLELTYTIRFQNYGNAPAGNVVILDTLGSMLDVSSFNFVGSSPLVPTIDLLEDSILQFTFNNINLPPISVDTLGSQGFVTFRIKTIENIQSGTVLNNRAAIYFDTNLPIITNTVTHTLVNELPDLTASLQTTDNGLETNITGNLYNWYFCENDSLAASTTSPSFSPAASGDFYVIVQTDDCNYQSECTSFIGIHEATEQDILLFPNPTDDLINFYMPASKARTIRIMNNVGDQVAILNPKGSQISYDTSLLPAGVYFVEIEDIDGLGMRSRFVVLH